MGSALRRCHESACLLVAFGLLLLAPRSAFAEPTEPVVIGWWSYFTPNGAMYKVPTVDPRHPVNAYGDPDTYYFEPSGGHGLQEDPKVLPVEQAWQDMISFILGKTAGASLSSTFTINTSSDLNSLREAYFGWAFLLLYVPKDKYCDTYRVHIGSVDDGVQAMANATILGYANLGQSNREIDMVDPRTGALVLRPGLNEVVLIHEDQAAVLRYVRNAWIEHNGVQVPLAAKNVVLGRVSDQASGAPLPEATVHLQGKGVDETFVTGPYGFYFFAGVPDGTYTVTTQASRHKQQASMATVKQGAAGTEVVNVDFALAPGCTCPNGQDCGPSGACLDLCQDDVDTGAHCPDPAATCAHGLCVTDPCDTLTCAAGFRCRSSPEDMPPRLVAHCLEQACANVCCQAGEVCSGGRCVPNHCGAACPDGQACSAGACVDACTVLTCVEPLLCVKGVCLDPCVVHPESCLPDASMPPDQSMAADTDDAGALGATSVSSGCSCRTDGRPPGARGFAVLGTVLVHLVLWRLRRRRQAARD